LARPPGRTDVADTGAGVDQLDLVVTVDSAVAHLAGALGKRAWVLLHDFPAWQWILRRDESGAPASPWYPTLKIIQKQADEDWPAALARMRANLIEIIPRT